MTDAQIIAVAAIPFALWVMWSADRHQRRVRDRSAERQDAQRLGRRQEPGPKDTPDTPETSSTPNEMEGK